MSGSNRSDHETTTSSASIEERLARLSSDQLAALMRRLRKPRPTGHDPSRVHRHELEHPLSLNQQRLWFVEQLNPNTPRYNVSRAVRMRGALDSRALHASLQQLVDRHEALRTTFHELQGRSIQRVNPPKTLPLPLADLRDDDDDGAGIEARLGRRLTEEGRRVFDLATDLMMRAMLYRATDDEHVLQLTFHHLAIDGWSLRLLFKELAILYAAHRSAIPAALPSTAARYVDFVRWQREACDSPRFDRHLDWWLQRLTGAPQALEIPTDAPRPRLQSAAGASRPFEIPTELRRSLRKLGRSEGATLFITLLTGLAILLHRWTGMTDMLIGTAAAGRRPETRGIVGFFVDTLALRVDVSGRPSVRELLRRVRAEVFEALSHAEVPFDRVVSSLRPQRDLSRPPLVQVMFNAPPQYTLELPGLDVSPIEVELEMSRFDLELVYADGDNRVTGLTWNTDLFDSGTIVRMLALYRSLLESMVEDPEQPIADAARFVKPSRSA